MLVLIDNFDSFTHNLVQYFQVLGQDVKVIRNNAISVVECLDLNPDLVVISPGPGTPSQSGISKPLITACAGRVPLLGICLGMQAIAEVFGGETVRGSYPIHGKTSKIYHKNDGVFSNIPQGFQATRYHSLVVPAHTLPSSLEVTAKSEDGVIMGLRHRHHLIEGVQFHPESILTECGFDLLRNFINYSTHSNVTRGAKYV
ncbi:MAG: aminodeoxychorismate/anthranilate synthase component II [Chlamydiota bacterium]|nr:aminodeoxychorismate/anthranilate synthase component II [Chlamydiota bacterium]